MVEHVCHLPSGQPAVGGFSTHRWMLESGWVKRPWRPFEFNFSFAVQLSSSSLDSRSVGVAASATSLQPSAPCFPHQHPHWQGHLLLSASSTTSSPSSPWWTSWSWGPCLRLTWQWLKRSSGSLVRKQPELGAGWRRQLELVGSQTQEQGKDGFLEQLWWGGT